MDRMTFKEWHERHDTLAICHEQGNTNMKPVPGDVAGVIYRGGARSEPVREDVVYPGPFRGVFVKSGVRPIDFTFSGLRDKKGLELTLAVACRLRFGSSEHDLQAVEKYFLKDDHLLMVEDFIDSVKEVLWEAAKAFTAERTARELIFEVLAGPMTGHLADYKPFNVIRFRMGLMPVEVESVQCRCPDYEDKLLADQLNKARKQEKIAEHEREKLALAYQAEEQRLREKLEQEGIEAKKATAMAEIEAREEVLKRLKESKFDLKGMDNQEVVDFLMSGLAPSALRLELKPVTETVLTRQFLVAMGKRVVAYDPYSDPATIRITRKTYSFEDGPLGYLRSVRVCDLDGSGQNRALVAGAQKGVYVLPLNDPDNVEEFKFPKAASRESSGGANAAVIAGNYLFATHSDYGLVRWNLEQGGPGANLFLGKITGAKTVRGLQEDGAGRLVFSVDGTVCRFDPTRLKPELEEFTGNEHEVTALAATPEHIYAGVYIAKNCSELIKWDKDRPAFPGKTGGTWESTVYKIRLLPLRSGREAIFIGTKLNVVPVMITESDIRGEFKCESGPGRDRRLRWIEAGPDFVFGVTRKGLGIFVWKLDFPAKPVLEIRTDEAVMDIALYCS
ncbi:MAG: hypothetical protein E3J72_21105 [Planctomycetota bacterium]|nr:MAG: hypothetical protein E3J72_21105 [Planctomycetota bacterium]